MEWYVLHRGDQGAITEAKKPETLQRRVAKTIDALEGLIRVAKSGGGGGHW